MESECACRNIAELRSRNLQTSSTPTAPGQRGPARALLQSAGPFQQRLSRSRCRERGTV